jgi:hypothetical protein
MRAGGTWASMMPAVRQRAQEPRLKASCTHSRSNHPSFTRSARHFLSKVSKVSNVNEVQGKCKQSVSKVRVA